MIPTDLLNMLAKVFDNKKYMVNIKTGSIDMFSIKLDLQETENENKVLASVSLILKDKEYSAQKEVASDEIRQIVDEMNMALTSPNNSFKMFDLVSSLIDYALSETNIKNDYVPLECLFRQSSLVIYTDDSPLVAISDLKFDKNNINATLNEHPDWIETKVITTSSFPNVYKEMVPVLLDPADMHLLTSWIYIPEYERYFFDDEIIPCPKTKAKEKKFSYRLAL